MVWPDPVCNFINLTLPVCFHVSLLLERDKTRLRLEVGSFRMTAFKSGTAQFDVSFLSLGKASAQRLRLGL